MLCPIFAVQKNLTQHWIMRKLLFLLPVLLIVQFCAAQNVGIGTNTPNANAALDISSSSKGLLLPRMDSVSRKNIAATNGLMVYDTTTKCFWYHKGSQNPFVRQVFEK